MHFLRFLFVFWLLGVGPSAAQSVYQCQFEATEARWAPASLAFIAPKSGAEGLVFDDVIARVLGEPLRTQISRSGREMRFAWTLSGGKTRRVSGVRKLTYRAAFNAGSGRLTMIASGAGIDDALLKGRCKSAPRNQVQALQALLKRPELRINGGGGSAASSKNTVACELKPSRAAKPVIPSKLSLKLENNTVLVRSDLYRSWGREAHSAKVSSRRKNDLLFRWKIEQIPQQALTALNTRTGKNTLLMQGRYSLESGKITLKGELSSGGFAVLDQNQLSVRGNCK